MQHQDNKIISLYKEQIKVLTDTVKKLELFQQIDLHFREKDFAGEVITFHSNSRDFEKYILEALELKYRLHKKNISIDILSVEVGPDKYHLKNNYYVDYYDIMESGLKRATSLYNCDIKAFGQFNPDIGIVNFSDSGYSLEKYLKILFNGNQCYDYIINECPVYYFYTKTVYVDAYFIENNNGEYDNDILNQKVDNLTVFTYME